MIKIVFVSPYAELADEVEAAFQQLDRADIQHKTLLVKGAEEELNSQLEGDVLIARGFSLRYLQKQKPEGMISVEISTTGYDLVMAVHECIRIHGKQCIAILGTESMVYSAQNFGSLFGEAKIDHYYMEDRASLGDNIDDAVANGAEALVGGRTVCRLAAERGLPATMIRTGREAIMKSLEMSIRLVEATRKEREHLDRVSKIMDYSYSGILSIDRNGIVRSINRKACGIFRVTERDALGYPVQQLIPHANIQQVIEQNEKLLDEICQIQGKVIMLNCVPIEGERERTGAVITCLEAQELQKTEAKIRKNFLQKGFVAKYSFRDIVYQDVAMRQTIEKANRFSRNESNVLIYGETGVGKEMFAQSIHNASRRYNGPFVAINCAALPEQLLESELFGYVEGAFTGAAKSGRMGLFEAAHRGTIFLDEIGDISPKLQGRLLRVIQEKEIVRLGDDHVIPIDVRVISATNKDLNEEVERGNFRSDLMYRLDVLKISIPSLACRKQDIMPLTWQFISEICQQEQKRVFKHIDPAAQVLLQEHSWKGNVRQLRNVVQRICVLCDGADIGYEVVVEALELGQVQMSSEIKMQDEQTQEEREQLRCTLIECKFQKGLVAERLGMNRSTLWRKMKKYNL